MDNKKENRRIEELINELTLDEKIGMVHGCEFFKTRGVERLGIPPLAFSDGPCGVRQEFEPDRWESKGSSESKVTYLPSNSAIASTWNRDLAREAGSVLGEEARGRGKDVILGPGVNLKRSPLCGRNFEYFSEDPYLTEEMAIPLIQGIQKWDVAACVKHYACNHQETERLVVNDDIDEKTLRGFYLPVYEEIVKRAKPYSMMAAYNKLNGTFCCEDSKPLQILRDEWKYDGLVVSDWGGVHHTESAYRSGLDVEMSVTDDFDDYCLARPLKKMIEEGRCDETDLNKKVTHILHLMFRLHMIGDVRRKCGTFNTPAHREAALKVARESIILLKNDRQILPLDPDKMESILVIGENADACHAPGGGSAEIDALYEITPLMGMHMLLGGNTKIRYAKGYTSGNEAAVQDAAWQATSLNDEENESAKGGESSYDGRESKLTRRLREEAVRLASEYDQVIFIGGLNHAEDREGHDRGELTLPYGQDVLISRLLEIRPDMVIVLTGGNPVEMNQWADHAHALIWNWYCGCEGGYALAEVLFGAVNPSGKLPVTFPKKLADCDPKMLRDFGAKDVVRYTDGRYVGYRYFDTYDVKPMFPFGYGLSYTKFELSAEKLIESEGRHKMSLTLTNTGARDGAETVQVYLVRDRDEALKNHLEVRELAGFLKCFLKAGESTHLIIPMSESKIKKDGSWVTVEAI